MTIEKFSFSIEDTNSYLIEEAGHAILVDACSADIQRVILERRLILDYIFLTHEHCDHLWGLNVIREKFHVPVITTKDASIAIQNSRQNRAKVHHIYITLRYGVEALENCTPDSDLSCKPAEITFNDEFYLRWYGNEIKFKATPGHSPGSCMMVVNDESIFVGDTLLYGQKIFTMFEGGSKETLNLITVPYIKSLPNEIMVYPGHGVPFYLFDYKNELM